MQVLPKIDEEDEDIKMMQEMKIRTMRVREDERQENLHREFFGDEVSFLLFLLSRLTYNSLSSEASLVV